MNERSELNDEVLSIDECKYRDVQWCSWYVRLYFTPLFPILWILHIPLHMWITSMTHNSLLWSYANKCQHEILVANL